MAEVGEFYGKKARFDRSLVLNIRAKAESERKGGMNASYLVSIGE